MHEKAILKPPSESKDPKGRFQDTTGTKYDTLWGALFSSFSYFGVSGGSLAQVWKRMPERSETRPSKTLKMVFPCTREHSFHFRRATRKWCSFSSFMASLWAPWPYFIEIYGFFLGVVFLDRNYEFIVRIGGARVGVWGAQGRDLGRGNPSRRGV